MMYDDVLAVRTGFLIPNILVPDIDVKLCVFQEDAVAVGVNLVEQNAGGICLRRSGNYSALQYLYAGNHRSL
jgi:hypothetical protein